MNKMKILVTLLSLFVLLLSTKTELSAFEPYLRNKIVVEDDANPNAPGGRFDGLHFGIDTAATDGLDTALGEQELFPQHPPSGVHAVFQIPNEQTGGIIWSYYDIRPIPMEEKFLVTHTINLQRPVLGSITMYWEEFPKDMLDSAILCDNIIGTIYRIDMLANKSATVENEGLSKFEVKLYYNKNKTSVNEYDEAKFSIYPNPASDKLYIQGANIINVNLFDLCGNEQILDKEKLSNGKTNLDISRMEKGLYIIRIMDDKGEYQFKKLIKE
jgi:hypothetical protein